jgi:hypothetical protein
VSFVGVARRVGDGLAGAPTSGSRRSAPSAISKTISEIASPDRLAIDDDNREAITNTRTFFAN